MTSLLSRLFGRRAKRAPVRWEPLPKRTATIYQRTHDEAGNLVSQSIRGSVDPHRDCRIMDVAVEFFYAHKRGVDITPEVLWRHVMGEEPPAIVITSNDRGECVAVTRQDAEGRVMNTIWSAPDICGNCASAMPEGCEGTFNDEPACRLHRAASTLYQCPTEECYAVLERAPGLPCPSCGTPQAAS